MLGSSEATSECLGSVCMASGDEESHSSGREYTFDESFSFKRESSASSPFEEEVETCLPGQVCRKNYASQHMVSQCLPNEHDEG